MILESFLGTAFLQAASGMEHQEWFAVATAVDWSNVMDAADEYMKDREKSRIAPDKGEGKGTFALWSKKRVANDFNRKSQEDALTAAFERDLPRRLKIEQALASTLRQLESLEAPSLAA